MQLSPRKGKLLALVAGLALVGIVLAGVGLSWFFGGNRPAKANLEVAASGVTTTPGTDSTAAGGVGGTWAVVPAGDAVGYADLTGTFAGFRIKEELRSIGSTTAVGRTRAVQGSMTIDGERLTRATFTVDLTTLTTNDDRRDDKVQRALETSQFPEATFVLTQPVDLGAADTTGALDAQATGDLTFHGVTRPVTFPLQAKLVGDTIVVVASTDLAFPDFGVDVPSSPVVLSAENHGILEVQLILGRA